MNYSGYIFDGEKKYKRDAVDPGATDGLSGKREAIRRLTENREKINVLQQALYAEDTRSLLVVFQAMDAAGKDGTIRHVFTGVNPEGIHGASFRQPSERELDRDFLWRIHREVPARGMIGIFNRSHYEDVLVAKVLDLPERQKLPKSTLKNIWKNRYRQIREFEQMLSENGVTILKFYLCLSKQEQTARFLSRMNEPDKNWKFSEGDLQTSESWDSYMRAYEAAINETATPYAPWCVIPADHKWYTRAVVSEIILDTLRKMKPAFPKASEEQLLEMEGYRPALEAEAGIFFEKEAEAPKERKIRKKGAP